jgi:hypothetical protein
MIRMKRHRAIGLTPLPCPDSRVREEEEEEEEKYFLPGVHTIVPDISPREALSAGYQHLYK